MTLSDLAKYSIKALLKRFAIKSSTRREDRKKFARLVREKRVNGERIDEMRERVKEMLEKKFGRQVNVAKLESLIINPQAVELRQDQQDYAVACAQELKDWNVRIHFIRSVVDLHGAVLFCEHLTFNALRYGSDSFTFKLLHTCLYRVSVHLGEFSAEALWDRSRLSVTGLFPRERSHFFGIKTELRSQQFQSRDT